MVGGEISVIIPTIPGRVALLERAVDSVVNQTREAWHIIVIGDPDRTGAAATRNRALESVDTEFVAFLDDDDEMLPEHLDVCYQAMQDSGADLVYPGMHIIGRDDPLAVALGGAWVNPFGVPFGPEQENHLRHAGNFIPVTWMARTGLVRAVGGFPDPTPRVPEDHGLLIRLLDAGARFHHVARRTWRYHVHGENTGGLGTAQAGLYQSPGTLVPHG